MNTHFIHPTLPLTSASHNQITNAILVIKVHVREVDSSLGLGSGSMKGNPLKESMVCDPIRGSRVSRYPIKGQSADFIVLEVTPAVTCGCACWHIDLATQWVRLHPACRMPRE